MDKIRAEKAAISHSIKSRRSEGCIVVGANHVNYEQCDSTTHKSRCFSSHMELLRPRSALSDISRSKQQLKDVVDISLRSRDDRRGDCFASSLAIQRKVSLAHVTVSPTPDKINFPHERRFDNFVNGRPLMRIQKLVPSRSLSRALTAIESKMLPPLYEGINFTEEQEQQKQKKRTRKYLGSHTTSSHQGKNGTAPDASPRRHLIGFLHRTSHLSLTSELSGNASFYLIGKCAFRILEVHFVPVKSDIAFRPSWASV